MRKIAATYIFSLVQSPIKYGIIVCENDGTIVDIINKGELFKEEAGVEFYSGIIVPGFVLQNCNLQNHDKISNRKMWAEGISLAADTANSTYVVPEKNGCKIQEFTVPLGIEDSLKFSSLEQNTSFINRLLLFQENNKHLQLHDLLKVVCQKGAKQLGFNSELGCFEVGKSSGINLISAIDFQQMKLTSNSKVKRLV